MGRQHSLDRAFTEQRGSVLVGGLLLVLAMTMIGVALFEAAVIETREVGFTADDVRAFYATETGLNRAALDVAWDPIRTGRSGARGTSPGTRGWPAAREAPGAWPDT